MIGWGAGVLVALLVPPQPAPAHRPLSPEELAQKAAVAGVARVVRSEVRKNPANGGIYTDYHLTFSEVWKGVPPAGFVLTQFGGTLDGESASAHGWNYALAPAERLVLFAVPMQGSAYCTVGLRQGLFRISPADPSRVVKDTETALPEARRSLTSLDELRARVFAALGRPRPPGAPAPAAAPAEEEKSTAPPAEAPTAPGTEPRTASPAPAPSDPLRSAGLALAGLLFLATLAIGWMQWRRKTENAE